MVKHYDKVWLSSEDKRLAKSAASLKGMGLSDYLGQRIREDVSKDVERLNAELKERVLKDNNKRRPPFGFFQK